MGLLVSRPECNVPSRMLLGISNAKSIVLNCSRHKILWTWGFLFVITAAILFGVWYTKNAADGEIKIPIWLAGASVAIGILYASQTYSNAINQLETEKIEMQLSGMSKKDYINYKIGDDRTASSFKASATSATVLAGTNILGPFLRADNR